MRYDVAVIGGGASGCATAILCARQGMNVLVIEGADRVLKKVLATGNGRCNYTSSMLSSEAYNTPFVADALAEFGYEDAVDFFHSLGMLTTLDNGRGYPYSRQAQTVLFALRNGMEVAGVRVVTGEKVTRIDKGFCIVTDTHTYESECVVLATGSNATTGIMSHDLVAPFGHKSSICTPSLTYLRCDKRYVAGLGGLRVKASAWVDTHRGRAVREGELLFKNDAISGIMVFELSSYFARRVTTSDIVHIDLAPDMDRDSLFAFLVSVDSDNITRLMGLLPKQLAILVDKLSGGDTARAVDIIKDYRVPVTGIGDIKNAQVVSGGLATEAFDSRSMQSRLVPGLYAVGEVLDVDGECGGYNLHWAWASAHMASRDIGAKYGKK